MALPRLIPEVQPDDSVDSTLKLLYDILAPGGQILISDFELTHESEFFHPKAKHDSVERHGIKRSDLEADLRKAGFSQVTVEESFKLPRPCEDGQDRAFPFIVVSVSAFLPDEHPLKLA